MKRETTPVPPGKYLPREDRGMSDRRCPGRTARRPRKYLLVTVLFLWDGLLLYMIVRCLIDGVFGAVFIAGISVYLGYHLK